MLSPSQKAGSSSCHQTVTTIQMLTSHRRHHCPECLRPHITCQTTTVPSRCGKQIVGSACSGRTITSHTACNIHADVQHNQIPKTVVCVCLIRRAVHTTVICTHGSALTWQCLLFAEWHPICFGRLPRHSLPPDAVLYSISAAIPSAAVSDSVQGWRCCPPRTLHARV